MTDYTILVGTSGVYEIFNSILDEDAELMGFSGSHLKTAKSHDSQKLDVENKIKEIENKISRSPERVRELEHTACWARVVIDDRKERLKKYEANHSSKLYLAYFSQSIADGETDLRRVQEAIVREAELIVNLKKKLREKEEELEFLSN